MKIRKANKNDFETICLYIRKIAEYEKMLDDITWSNKELYEQLFIKENAYVLIGELDNKPIGFALYCTTFSTFRGKQTLYLEDLFIDEEYRNKGYGKMFFTELLKIAKTSNAGRMEWVCLDWNISSINFYKYLGAKAMDEWTTYRLSDDKFDETIKKISLKNLCLSNR